MKRTYVFAILLALLLPFTLPSHAQFFNRLKQAAKDKAEQTVSGATDSVATPAPAPVPAPAAPQEAPTPAPQAASAVAPSNGTSTTSAPAPIIAYQNYDFTPGNIVIFADDFTTTQDGEFPDQWELLHGQGAANKQQGFETFTLTDGNYARVVPRVRTKDYLGGAYTIEFDTYTANGRDIIVMLERGDQEASVDAGSGSVEYHADGVDLSGSLPEAISGSNYNNHWHHVALAVKNNQLKVYVDQYRVLVVPDMKFSAESLQFAGIGAQDNPLIFTNVRIASGGGMNLVGQKFTDAKIVTYGINFDVDKATLRPESMGTLNQIKRLMDANPDLKFEVDGHTDNSGSAAHNLTLSQQRANAVMQQLIAMGVSASRLTAKGFGDTKPIADNGTPEGKANNRRVEFVRVT